MTEHDATAALAAATDDINLSELLVRAVVQSFYQPTPLGYQNQAITIATPTGQMQGLAPVMQYGDSPLQKTARMIFQAHEAKILEKVMEALDVDAIAATIAEDVARRLKESDDYGNRNWDRLRPAAEAIRTAVRDRLADQLAADTRARFEAEQNAMYEAWQREQERARQQAVLETGPDSGS